MGYKSDSGKGDLIRQGFDWNKYGYTYERLFHPHCKSCGTIMEQRTGWSGVFYCPNENCKQYYKFERK